MIYLLELPDGTRIRCDSAAQAKRYAEFFVIMTTGAPPVTGRTGPTR
jgi:hypothetical protein